MKHFLSCDWGTSSLRLRLADTNDGKVWAETQSGEGIAQVFEQWQRSGLEKDKKAAFYMEVINRQVRELENQTGQPLSGLTLVLSGMASSSIGFIDLPYAPMPFSTNGEGIITALIGANRVFEHDVLVLSGAKTDDDMMRGEETQLIGCIGAERTLKSELFIFPGTHSKHISVKNNEAVGLKTFMTGEVFSLLAQKSVLKNSVERGAFNLNPFKRGLKESVSGNLLHSIFKVRTNSLFAICSENENYHYLSGLLIGAEINELASNDAVEAINLVCGDDLLLPYQVAIDQLASGKKLTLFSGDQATVRGQLIIAKQLNLLT